MNVAERIKEVLEDLNLPQQLAARLSKTNPGTINHAVRQGRAGLVLVQKLATGLGLPAAVFLMTREEAWVWVEKARLELASIPRNPPHRPRRRAA